MCHRLLPNAPRDRVAAPSPSGHLRAGAARHDFDTRRYSKLRNNARGPLRPRPRTPHSVCTHGRTVFVCFRRGRARPPVAPLWKSRLLGCSVPSRHSACQLGRARWSRPASTLVVFRNPVLSARTPPPHTQKVLYIRRYFGVTLRALADPTACRPPGEKDAVRIVVCREQEPRLL